MTYEDFKANQEKEDLRTILKSKWGLRFVWRQLSKAGIFKQSFVPDSPDFTAFNEGKRSVGNALLAEVIEIDPEAFVKMQKMSKKDEEERKEEYEREHRDNDGIDGND